MQSAARGFGLACALEAVDGGDGAYVLVEDQRIGEDLLDLFNAVQNLNEPRVMVVEGTLHGAVGKLFELGQFLVRQRRAHGFDDVQPRQRAYAVAALGIAERLEVGELGVAVRLDGFADDFREPVGENAVFNYVAAGVDHPQSADGKLDRLVFVDQAHVVRLEVGEDFDLRPEPVGDLLVCGQREADVGVGLGDHGQDFIALCGLQRLCDAAGHNPSGMNALFAQKLNDVLSEAAQSDAGAAQFRPGGDDAEDMARFGVGLHAQQQVGRGEIKEAQRVGLNHLGQIQHAAQLRGGVWNPDGHDGLAGPGRGDEVRDRTDAADAGHEAGHLVEWPALREPLKAADLRDVEVRVFDFALAVKLNRDLAVAFEAGYGVDGNCLAH